MAGRDPETNPAAFLGAELRRARLAAGFSSQDSLAAKLGFDRTVIAKAETGDRPPTTEVLAAWCATCQLEETIDQCWRKSSYSGNGGADCVEIAGRPGLVLVQDTKDHAGSVLRFAPAAWRRFAGQVKRS
jgi:transcriptional regulator with XRE-family HTH domain